LLAAASFDILLAFKRVSPPYGFMAKKPGFGSPASWFIFKENHPWIRRSKKTVHIEA
jgi:hypothetical protein